ncbi:Heteroproteinous nuclear ribonucleoprotein A1 [Coemansia aciculifera]|uniref:Heteroproteinous nuclear ribonucleoprotein A1 n=1 Tax=Coemansia aciculifera TaxID=417176 RepID=A0A9W8IHM3_9FUNG|nr:Heteroproteinous nuclear ribonucleoprotein A1 [Coemansia aciculifera]
MTDNSKTAEDSLYTDNFGSSSGAYAYDPYQESGSQWLYNDSQSLQVPQADVNAAELSAGAVLSTSNVDSNRGAYTASSGAKDEGKLFVGGLSWETDEIKLRNYFSRYGNIVDCTIMRDPMSSRPRGFGFVTFDSMDGVNAVLQEPSHNLDGKAIDPKHAVPRDGQTTQRRNYNNNNNQSMGGYGGGSGSSAGPGGDSYNDPVQSMKGEKIFVGRLPPSITEADLNSSFSEFGGIVEAKLMLDRETGRPRNFGFLQFEAEDAALEAVKVGNSVRGIVIHGQRIDVKPAFHKKRPPMGAMGMMGGAGAPSNAYGMMGMPGYGMMGMPGYGMMGMPGYGMMGMMGANGNVDYSAAMNYGNIYGSMGGYYGGDGSGAPGGADASAAAATAGYYGQMGMPNNGFYGGNGTDGGQPDQSSGAGNAGAAGGGSGDKGGSGYYDQQDGSGANSYSNKGSRQGDDRGSGRDGGNRSSTRRHGSSANDRASGGRSDRSRNGDQSNHSGTNSGTNSGSRSRDDYRSSRGGRPGRDRDGPVRGSHGNSSSRGHGYTPY